MSGAAAILLAGGGTGGHIYPNLAVIERLDERRLRAAPYLVVSTRPLDARIARRAHLPHTPLPAEPLGLRPDRLARFARGFAQAVSAAVALIDRLSPAAVVATGGFVTGPVLYAARRRGVPSALVNLDAVPGRANRLAARWATRVFSVYPTDRLPRAQGIGMPLRRSAVGGASPAEARRALGLAEDRSVLLVTAGSQGARTINRAMIELVGRTRARAALGQWQVLHLCGEYDREALVAAYASAGVPARVEPFCHRMGLAWSSATLAVSRAGAGSVAEAWAGAVPTVFLPYPFHRDQHQRLNAEPLVNRGGAVLVRDRVEPIPTAQELLGPLLALVDNATQRRAMRGVLAGSVPPDGAAAVAQWVAETAGLGVA